MKARANIFIVWFLIVLSANCSHGLDFWEFLFGPRLGSHNATADPDSRITEKIVKNYGYRLDTHLVASETGHILTLHRIPRGRKKENETEQNAKRPIAFIHHGLLGCSDMWLLRGPQFDLPYLLADAGYDVWLFNTRGNFHSRKHKTLNPDQDPQYWDFGIEEIGYYDVPATIDYILNITEQEKLFFLGHSIGSSSALISCSMRPEYNDKIRLFLALGPLANVKHTLNPIHKIVFSMGANLLNFLSSQNIQELMPRRAHISKIIDMACGDGSPMQKMCLMMLFTVVGADIYELNTTSTFPNFIQYYPSGTSARLLLNVVQYYLTGKFARDDYGSLLMNFLHYNSSVPPSYDLSKVTTPVSLFYGEGDFLVTKEDINDLALQLPNVVEKTKIPHKYFNHLDFVLAINARNLLYENLVAIMDKYR